VCTVVEGQRNCRRSNRSPDPHPKTHPTPPPKQTTGQPHPRSRHLRPQRLHLRIRGGRAPRVLSSSGRRRRRRPAHPRGRQPQLPARGARAGRGGHGKGCAGACRHSVPRACDWVGRAVVRADAAASTGVIGRFVCASCPSPHPSTVLQPQSQSQSTQVTPTGVHCRILCVGPRALDVEFKGLIR